MEKIKKIFNSVIKTLKDKDKIKTNISNYFKKNKLFIAYLVITFFNVYILRCLTVSNWYNLKTIFLELSIIGIIGSFSYLLKPKKSYRYLLIVLIIITTVCVVNAIYYTWYSSFASFSLIAAIGQVGKVSSAFFEKLRFDQFIYIILFITFIFICKKFSFKEYHPDVILLKKKYFLNTLITFLIILAICLVFSSKTEYSRLSKQWNRESIVQSFGIIIYQSNDLIKTLNSKVNSLFGYDEAALKFVDYFNNKEDKNSNNEYTNIFVGKNLITFHLESIMTMLIDLKINDIEITPNLNKLVKEGLYFKNFYPEISVGTSSDTEFTLNTSLLPVASGTVFVNYYNRDYVSLEKLLKEKGYYTFSMHGNKASMWNRDKMHPSLGYQEMYFQDKYEIDEEIGLGLSDKSFFRQIIPYLKEIEENSSNYMGTIITLSNHTPFEDLDKYPKLDLSYTKKSIDTDTNEEIITTYDYLENTLFGNYIKSAHYADQALGDFINYIYENDILNNTVIVFYGDHNPQISRNDFNYYFNYDFETGKLKDENDETYYNYDYYAHELNKNTPLLIWTKDHAVKGEIDYYMGTIDILPTLSNMFGIKNKFALGHDIFEIKNENIIAFPNGNFLTKDVYYSSTKEEYKPLTNNPTREEYIENCKIYTENIIEISNNIIIYDLIKNEKDRVK